MITGAAFGTRAPEEIYWRCQAGDLEPLPEMLRRLALAGSEGRGWALAFRALASTIDAALAPPIQADEAMGLIGESAVRSSAILACREARLASVLSFDANGVIAWAELECRLLHDGGDEDSAGLAVCEAWLALARGQSTREGPAEGEPIAAGSGDGARTVLEVEQLVVAALLAARRGDVSTGVTHARQACRRARGAKLPRHEYLSNIVLARLRRYSGRPHLATAILNGVAAEAPPAWLSWLAWEMLVAGGGGKARALLEDERLQAGDAREQPSFRAARALASTLDAASAGDRGAFEESSRAVTNAVAAWAHLAREVEVLLCAIDMARPSPDAEVAAWRSGEVAQLPAGLAGVGTPETHDSSSNRALACVVAPRSGPGIRVLRLGLRLASPGFIMDRDAGDTDAREQAGGSRLLSAIAVLALAGPAGLARATFFQKLYGFRFVAERHQGVLDVMIHRVRERLGDAGDVQRGGDGPELRLALREPIIVSDGRCVLPVSDLVLRAIARLGRATSADAASMLGLPLRTVQNAVSALVEDGACNLERQGRRVTYRIQDTAVTKLTRLPAPHEAEAALGPGQRR